MTEQELIQKYPLGMHSLVSWKALAEGGILSRGGSAARNLLPKPPRGSRGPCPAGTARDARLGCSGTQTNASAGERGGLRMGARGRNVGGQPTGGGRGGEEPGPAAGKLQQRQSPVTGGCHCRTRSGGGGAGTPHGAAPALGHRGHAGSRLGRARGHLGHDPAQHFGGISVGSELC